MNFKKWINLIEMAHFSVSANHGFFIPCDMCAGVPCKGGAIGAIDMRFEDPDAYPAPYNKLNNGSKFSALIPRTKQYIVHHNHKDAEVLSEVDVIKMQYVPVKNNKIDHSVGSISDNGYYLIPDSWYIHAELFGQDYKKIKSALADFNGKRKDFLNPTSQNNI